MLERIARWCFHRRRLVLVLWIVGFIAFGFFGSAFNGGYTQSTKLPGSDAVAAFDLLKARFPQQSGDSVLVVFKADRGIDDPAVRPRVEGLIRELARQPHVSGTTSPYSPQGNRNVAPDRTVAFGELQLDKPGFQLTKSEGTDMIAAARKATGNGVDFELSGELIQNAEFSGGGGSEGAGILAAVVILLIAFGSVLAMGLPILMAVMGIGIGFAIIELIANVVPVPNFTPIIAAMIGIGVGIDYALFIVTRYRQSLHDGLDPEEAVVRSIRTAGRAVLFAGTIVVISVLGMLLMNLPFLQGVAFGSAAAVLVTMLGSITLLPAMLGFVGHKIDSLHVPFLHSTDTDYRSGFWFRWSRVVQRRPWLLGGIGAVLILVLAIPAFSLKLGFPDESTQPKSRMSTQAYDLLVAGFGPGYTGRLLVAAELPNRQSVAVVDRLRTTLQADPDVIPGTVSPVSLNPQGNAALVNLTPKSGPQADAT